MGNVKKFCGSNKTRDKVLRTILQGVISAIVVNLDLLVGLIPAIPVELKTVLVPVLMAILTPIMAALGGGEGPAELTDDEAEWMEDEDPEATSEIDGEAI